MTYEMAIARGRRWMLWADVARACTRGSAAAAFVALGVVVWGCVAGGVDWPLTVWSALGAGAAVTLALLIGPKATPEAAAARLDDRHGLKAVMSSALFASQVGSPLAVLVREEANRAAAAVEPRRAADFRFGRAGIIAAVLLAIAVVLAMWGPRWDAFGWQQQAQQAAEEKRVVTAEAKRLQTALASLLPTTTTLRLDNLTSPGMTLRAAMEAELKAAEKAPTARDSMARLTSVAEKIEQARREAEQRREPTQAKLNREAASSKGAESRLEKALRSGNTEAAKAELQKLAQQAKNASDTSSTKAAVAAALREAAARQSDDQKSEALSAAMEDLAKALESGSDKDMQKALADAEKALENMKSDREMEMAERKAYEEMLRQLNQSQQAVASSCKGGTCSACKNTSGTACSSCNGGGSLNQLLGLKTGTGPNWGVGTSNIDAGVGKEAEARSVEDRNSERESRWTEKWLKRYDAQKTDTTAHAVRVTGRMNAGPLGGGYDIPSQPRVEVPRTATEPAAVSAADAQKDALARSEIPRSYQQQVKQYFDSLDSE